MQNHLTGTQALQLWPKLPVLERFRLLRQLATALHSRYQRGLPLREICFETSEIHGQGRQLQLRLWPPASKAKGASSPLPALPLLQIFADWYALHRPVISRLEAAFFLHAFLRHEASDGTQRRAAARQVDAMLRGRARLYASATYRAALHEPLPDTFSVDAPQFQAALAAPETLLLKESPRIRVHRSRLPGLPGEVLVKRYAEGGSPWRRFRNRFRPSHARHAHAVAHCFATLDLPCPVSYGYLETRDDQGQPVSYHVSEFLRASVTARSWIKPQLHRRPRSERDQVARELQELLLDLYDHGLYHSDTKTSNLMVSQPDDPRQRRYAWIDLEAVQVGVAPSRRRLLRNLVQLNGSLGRKLPEAERLLFLRRLARSFPALNAPWIPGWIEAQTRRRLQRELLRICGY